MGSLYGIDGRRIAIHLNRNDIIGNRFTHNRGIPSYGSLGSLDIVDVQIGNGSASRLVCN